MVGVEDEDEEEDDEEEDDEDEDDEDEDELGSEDEEEAGVESMLLVLVSEEGVEELVEEGSLPWVSQEVKERVKRVQAAIAASLRVLVLAVFIL